MNVLIVSPHPDDETLGAGGTAFRFAAEGKNVSWLNITGAEQDSIFSDEFKEKRKIQLKKIEELYRFENVYNLNLKTTRLETYDSSDVIEKISAIFKEAEPEMLILPDYNDVHSDHKKVFEWCYACSKIFRFPFVRQIMTMEIVSETEFGSPQNPFYPNYYVDITDYMDKKIQAMEIYDTELAAPPFPRSIENIKALAAFRGAAAGVKYAEAFRLVKSVV